MAQITQIQVRFDPVQDRLLLRVNTQDRLELRFWLTRRMLKLLWPPLLKGLAASAGVDKHRDPSAREAILAFQREKAVAEADFATPYREDAAHLPLGDTPVLVSRLQLNPQAGGGVVLSLQPDEGPGAELALNEVLLHSLCKLLASTAEAARWDLSLSPREQEPTAPSRLN